MQEIHHSTGGGGGGRLFGGGGGGGDRRLRPHHHPNHQALKCPRCDSLNTKFCYYNNYNLSQPRHFCKSCRRYWTKGGVLRNVPVGGGCRKTKRSKPKQQQANPAAAADTTNTPPPQEQPDQQQQRQREQLKSSNSHSSSESSSLTATNTASTAVEAASGHSSSTTPNTHNSSSNCNINNSTNILNGIDESKLFSHANNLNPNSELGLQSDCGIFSEIGSFSSLINSNNEQLQFGFGSLMMNQMGLDGQGQDQPWQHQNQKMMQQQQQHRMGGINGEEVKMQEMDGGDGGLIDDPTVQVDQYSTRFGALDWQGTGDPGLFDLHNTVDQAYWTSQSQWTDQDHPSLYLP